MLMNGNDAEPSPALFFFFHLKALCHFFSTRYQNSLVFRGRECESKPVRLPFLNDLKILRYSLWLQVVFPLLHLQFYRENCPIWAVKMKAYLRAFESCNSKDSLSLNMTYTLCNLFFLEDMYNHSWKKLTQTKISKF